MIVGIRFQDLFHSPNRGSFNLSLTVLVRYRCVYVFSLRRWSSQIPTRLACLVVLRYQLDFLWNFKYGAFTLYGRPFQRRSSITFETM